MNRVFEKLIAIIILPFIFNGCYKRGGDSMPLEGGIELITDGQQNLCFKPLFNTVRYPTDAPLGDEVVEVEYLNLARLTMSNYATETAKSKKIFITPTQSKYYKLHRGEMICLNSNVDELSQKGSIPRTGEEVYVFIYGLTDDMSRELYFQKEFLY